MDIPVWAGQGGAVGAVLFCMGIFLWAMKWLIERNSTTQERVGDKLNDTLQKATTEIATANREHATRWENTFKEVMSQHSDLHMLAEKTHDKVNEILVKVSK